MKKCYICTYVSVLHVPITVQCTLYSTEKVGHGEEKFLEKYNNTVVAATELWSSTVNYLSVLNTLS